MTLPTTLRKFTSKGFDFKLKMESRLAEYRARKRKLENEERRKELVWSVVTFASLRQKLINFLRPQPPRTSTKANPPNSIGSSTSSSTNCTLEQEALIPEADLDPWTQIDFAILGVGFLLWIVLFYASIKAEIGAVYILTSGFALIWLNLGTRRSDQASAYSVFNPNCESIDGTLTAEQFEREIRHRNVSSR
ncbi:hypothetical protein TCAL_11584 [Tigriopus californicus]|uniref:SAYSvFN domain-containing protein n=1 Tax=Tigriopus californicus TaxID=6832 RepID=A0A553NCB0_TIGCA|nr:SAYSvFN domain-containing protein 1-like [Tigriopus californicus]TRY63081.1 hypothetical protein TCAL_11584 [Tigriopus californicus]